MNTIVVLLRVGRDPTSFTVNRKAEKIFIHRDEWRTAPADLNALELALQLGDQGHTVIAVALGGDEAAVALREARAMGAARAVWVRDDALRNADAGPLVAVVQRVLEHVGGVDLVLMGATVEHADLAQVGPRLAVALGWPLTLAARAVQADEAGATIKLTQRGYPGFHVAVQTSLPAVATVETDANKPRYARAANIILIYSNPDGIERMNAADLGLDEAALKPLVARRGELYPPERLLGELIIGSADDAARHLAAAFPEEW